MLMIFFFNKSRLKNSQKKLNPYLESGLDRLEIGGIGSLQRIDTEKAS